MQVEALAPGLAAQLKLAEPLLSPSTKPRLAQSSLPVYSIFSLSARA